MLTTIVIIAIVAAGIALWYFNRDVKGLDVNADGKVDVADAKVAVEKAVEGVKTAADVNSDGKVDVADAKVVVEKAKAGVKKAAAKAKPSTKPAAKTATKKPATRGRKPKAQK